MDTRLTIGAPVEPRPEDVHSFLIWLDREGVKPLDRTKIKATTMPLEDLKRPGIALSANAGTKGGTTLYFRQDWYFAHEFGDYRLTYDARHQP